jgi:hypothetical protein
MSGDFLVHLAIESSVFLFLLPVAWCRLAVLGHAHFKLMRIRLLLFRVFIGGGLLGQMLSTCFYGLVLFKCGHFQILQGAEVILRFPLYAPSWLYLPKSLIVVPACKGHWSLRANASDLRRLCKLPMKLLLCNSCRPSKRTTLLL